MAASTPATGDIIYQNVFVRNTSAGLVDATYLEDRATALIERPEDWIGSIVRFQIPLMQVPLIAFHDSVPFYVAATVAGSTYTERVAYATRTSLTSSQYVYDVQHMLDMVNDALQELTDQLVAGGSVQLTEAPYLIYDSATYQFKLVALKNVFYPEVSDVGPDPAVAGIRLFFNENLYQYFKSLPVYTFPLSVNTTTGCVENILINDYGNNEYDATHWSISQSSSSMSLWHSAKKLVITTGTIPIVAEWLSNANSSGPTAGLGGGSGALSVQILTDFAVGTDDVPINNSYAVYTPSIFRYFSMISGTPLRRIDLQVFWQMPGGDLVLLQLPLNAFFEIKLMFVRKAVSAIAAAPTPPSGFATAGLFSHGRLR